MSRQSYDDQLQHIRLALGNAPEFVTENTSAFNFTNEKIQEGVVLYEETLALFDLAHTYYSEQKKVGLEFNKKEEAGFTYYMNHIKMARHKFDGRIDGGDEMQLFGRRKKTFAGWITQARRFYNAGINNPDIQTMLGEVGIAPEHLQNGLTMMDELIELKKIHNGKKAKSQQANRDKYKSYDDLLKWFSTFKEACQITCRARPDILEALGFVQYSPGYKKKKKKVSTTDPNPEPDPEPTPEPDPEPDPEPNPDPNPEPEPEPDPEPDPEQPSETD